MTTALTVASDGIISGNWAAVTSSTYSTGAGTTVNLVYQGTPEMVTPDEVMLKGSTDTEEVPAGEVIAREDVLGIIRPLAATMATTSGVVLFPGIPPMLCLSTTIG